MHLPVRRLKRRVARVERKIFDLESDYLLETDWGNILTGWDSLEEATAVVRRPTGLRHRRRSHGRGSRSGEDGSSEKISPVGTGIAWRHFSWSSVTSPASFAQLDAAKNTHDSITIVKGKRASSSSSSRELSPPHPKRKRRIS